MNQQYATELPQSSSLELINVSHNIKSCQKGRKIPENLKNKVKEEKESLLREGAFKNCRHTMPRSLNYQR